MGGHGLEADFWPMEGSNIQVKTVLLKNGSLPGCPSSVQRFHDLPGIRAERDWPNASVV